MQEIQLWSLGRSPGGGNGNPLQYSCLENPMDRGAWWVTVHRVTKSQTWLRTWPVSLWHKASSTFPRSRGFGQGASWYLSRAASFQLSYFVEEEDGLRAQSIKALPCLTAQLGHIGDKKTMWTTFLAGSQRSQPWGKRSLHPGLESLG